MKQKAKSYARVEGEKNAVIQRAAISMGKFRLKVIDRL